MRYKQFSPLVLDLVVEQKTKAVIIKDVFILNYAFWY